VAYIHGISPLMNQDGIQQVDLGAWTGLASTGNPQPSQELGTPNLFVSSGLSDDPNDATGLHLGTDPLQLGQAYYGFATFTAAPLATGVPEPSGITLALVGLVVSAAARVARRRRAAARG
jgi:hypothetical protein